MTLVVFLGIYVFFNSSGRLSRDFLGNACSGLVYKQPVLSCCFFVGERDSVFSVLINWLTSRVWELILVLCRWLRSDQALHFSAFSFILVDGTRLAD